MIALDERRSIARVKTSRHAPAFKKMCPWN